MYGTISWCGNELHTQSTNYNFSNSLYGLRSWNFFSIPHSFILPFLDCNTSSSRRLDGDSKSYPLLRDVCCRSLLYADFCLPHWRRRAIVPHYGTSRNRASGIFLRPLVPSPSIQASTLWVRNDTSVDCFINRFIHGLERRH